VLAPDAGGAVAIVLVTHVRTDLPTCLMKYLASHTMEHMRLIPPPAVEWPRVSG